MDQGSIVPSQLAEYPFSSDQDCIDDFSAHAHHAAYPSHAGDIRRDGSLSSSNSATFTYGATNANAPRFAEPGLAAEYRFANPFPLGNSTSPSSGSSSIAYNTTGLSQAPHAGLQSFTPAVQPQNHAFVQSYALARGPQLGDDASTYGVLPRISSIRSPRANVATIGDRNSYAGLRGQLPLNAFGTFAEIPRTLFTTSGVPFTSPTVNLGPMAPPAQSHHNRGGESEINLDWPDLQTIVPVEVCSHNGNWVSLNPLVYGKVEKGLFMSTGPEEKWTCYRRNYFTLTIGFAIAGFYPGSPMRLPPANPGGPTRPIHAFGLRITSLIDGNKNLELVGHTPKRDCGPKFDMGIIRISPSQSGATNAEYYGRPHVSANTQDAAPYLPLQCVAEKFPQPSYYDDEGAPLKTQRYPGIPGTMPVGSEQSHTFERMQFKQATANNGKRRASQQYFNILIELYADVRENLEDPEPAWVMIAKRSSDKIVVRGRSPSHYQHEGRKGANKRGGGSGGAAGHAGGARGHHAWRGHKAQGWVASSSSGYPTNYGGANYAANGMYYQQSLPVYDTTPTASGSSPESGESPEDEYSPGMSDLHRGGMQPTHTYQQNGRGVFETAGMTLPPLWPAMHHHTDARGLPVKVEYGETAPGSCASFGSLSTNLGPKYEGEEGGHGYLSLPHDASPGYE